MLRQIKPGRGFFAGLSKNLLLGSFIAPLFVSCIAGCGDFFASRATELESQNLLRELETVKLSTGKDIPLPEVYLQPPRIIENTLGNKKDAKLFYFSRYHTVDKLAVLVKEQFKNVMLSKKGKDLWRPYYNVATNLSTNQMIVRCPSVEDAQQVLDFLNHTDVQPIQVKIDTTLIVYLK